ncbi:ASCH domain-containing protein [Loktanella salsilacus]|uniref:ASCH domain-containing protein n=1 Tax=Loktanella salsilacus TaxID=195913 RepID=UPI0037366338
MTDPAALTALRRRYPGAETFTFGDGPDLCARLLTLVRNGQKTASTGALRDYDNGDPLPVPGRCDIALHWDGRPAFVIETQQVITCPFHQVTEAMALAEGENADLTGWRRDHIAFFTRNGGFDPDMQVVWERFKMIQVC